MAIGDIFVQPVFTEFVKRNIDDESQMNTGGENRAFFGARIAPLVAVQSTVTKLRFADVKPYGLGQFKAPNATPPLYKPTPVFREEYIELALLEEMERFTAEEWRKLNTVDQTEASRAMLELGDRMRILQLRNDRLTEWMRWQAFRGTLAITYPDGGQITVDYGFTSAQLPTISTAWTDTTNADPIEDLYAQSQVTADLVGEYASIAHMNSQTWRLVQRNKKIQAYLSALGRQVMLPTTADFQQLMREGTANFEIIDAGYLPENATNRRLTKFLPDNRVLLTAGGPSYTIGGTRIADVADGQVAVGGGPNEAPNYRQGMQSELMGHWLSKQVVRRQASARIPRLYFPEAFVWMTVGA
jgi:hypothetical protein